MDFKMYEYTHAIVGKVTPSLRITDKADLNDARRQHDCYLRLLRELNLEVLELDLGENFPENVFVEDIAIVCHGIALLPKPLTSADEKKKKIIMEVLQKDLGQTVVEISDPEVKLLASDVLFTGREFFVGVTENTNEDGALAVAEAFPEFPCTPVRMSRSDFGCGAAGAAGVAGAAGAAGGIKRLVSVAGPELLCCGRSEAARRLLRRMEREATFAHRTLTVPEDAAVDCVYVNGTLIHRAIEEIPQSFKVFCEKIDFARRSICYSELAKLSNGLRSGCLLVRKP